MNATTEPTEPPPFAKMNWDSLAPEHAGKLSVLVPVYNEEKYVTEILARVLDLGPVVKEIVVVDDGSKDRTAEVIRAFAEGKPKIHFHQQPKNQGKTAAISKAR